MKLKILLTVLVLIVSLFLLDFFRVRYNYRIDSDLIIRNQNNSEYFNYFENIYKNNNGLYNKEHSKEKFILDLEKDFGDEFDDDSLKLFSKRYVNLYFIDPFSGKNYKYYPIYNNKNFIKGYVLLSSGLDREINNQFDSKLYIDDLEKFKLYSKNYKFNYLDYYFGVKDVVISSSFKKD